MFRTMLTWLAFGPWWRRAYVSGKTGALTTAQASVSWNKPSESCCLAALRFQPVIVVIFFLWNQAEPQWAHGCRECDLLGNLHRYPVLWGLFFWLGAWSMFVGLKREMVVIPGTCSHLGDNDPQELINLRALIQSASTEGRAAQHCKPFSLLPDLGRQQHSNVLLDCVLWLFLKAG